MGGRSNDRQVVVTGNKEFIDFYTPGWISMTVVVTFLSGNDEKWFM